MEMQVKHVLPGGSLIRLNDTEPVRRETALHEMSDLGSASHHFPDKNRVRIQQVTHMGSRNNESMPECSRRTIQERDSMLVLPHEICWGVTCRDETEDTVFDLVHDRVIGPSAKWE